MQGHHAYLALAAVLASIVLPPQSSSCARGAAAARFRGVSTIALDGGRFSQAGGANAHALPPHSQPANSGSGIRESDALETRQVDDSVFVVLRVAGPTPSAIAERWILLARGNEPANEQTGAAEFEVFLDAKGRVICAASRDRAIDVTLLVPGKRTRIQATGHCIEASLRDGLVGLTATSDPRSEPAKKGALEGN